MSLPYEFIVPDVPGGQFYETTASILEISSLEDSEYAVVNFGFYDDLSWNSKQPPLSDTSIVSWGTKMLPGAGPFYFSNGEDGYPTLGHLDTDSSPNLEV